MVGTVKAVISPVYAREAINNMALFNVLSWANSANRLLNKIIKHFYVVLYVLSPESISYLPKIFIH